MKNKGIWILLAGIVFVGVGVGGYIVTSADDSSIATSQITEYFNNTDNEVYSDVDYNTDDDADSDSDDDFLEMRSMMYGYYNRYAASANDEAYSVDVLTEEVEQYISNFDEDLEVGDIFVFSDSEYYYSIIEADTGKGAMELLVNPYTKQITPEYGPNMMWNLKYGMMNQYGCYGNRGRGMMGRGMMGYYYDEDDTYYNNDYSDENDLTAEEAYEKAVEYLADNDTGLTVGEEYHDFYGYYTFHVEKDEETVGMLSVNGFDGTVWYHNWHGELVEIIEGHE